MEIYNQYFRDQNYQPPIPYSKENVYEGFLLEPGSYVSLGSNSQGLVEIGGGTVSDGSYPAGAILKDIYGDGFKGSDLPTAMSILPRRTSWSALWKPLKANKLHDAITTVLPSPQKGPAVTFSLADSAPVTIPSGQTDAPVYTSNAVSISRNSLPLRFASATTGLPVDYSSPLFVNAQGSTGKLQAGFPSSVDSPTSTFDLAPLNLSADIPELKGTADLTGVSAISVDDLRLGFAMQQLYELYGRSGSRYRELCHAMFGVDVDDPFSDIPRMLGHVRFPLELYQTAQTSSSDGTSPQGNLAAFGYTNKGGFLFHETFLEHGFVHILCVIRQRNVYPAYLAPHWFRLNQLDFYTPILANISEQPILLRTVNPFGDNSNATVFGYQEAWWEYRRHPAMVTGVLRSGVEGNLSLWTYQDIFDENQSSADADFMESNAQEVLDNTLAVESANAPQFKALFMFYFDHEFPGPVYSVPGLDEV